jgi:hypothetical protein
LINASTWRDQTSSGCTFVLTGQLPMVGGRGNARSGLQAIDQDLS